MFEKTHKSMYAQVPGLQEANQGRSSESGPVKQALRSLGFEQQTQALSPQDRSGPVPLPEGSGGVAARKAQLLLDQYGRSVEGLAQGLSDMELAKDRGVLDALEAAVGKMTVTKAVLGEHLARTGRANAIRPQTDKLGGARSEGADARAETYAGQVLAGIDKATQERQGSGPKAHGLSGHGKGTDQLGRLLHGRRSDELAEELDQGKVPTEMVTLSGNEHGLGDVTVPKFTTTGQDTSNISGAFDSHLGMLQVVGEAFSQADLITQSGHKQRGDDPEQGTKLGQERMTLTVEGPGRGVGYNVALDNRSGQSKQSELQSDEMQARFRSIKRTDDVRNAKVVLDPAFNDKGQRVGWSMQTAYPSPEAPTANFGSSGEVEGSQLSLEARKEAAELNVQKAVGAVKEAREQVEGCEKGIASKQKTIDGMGIGLAKAKQVVNPDPKTLGKIEGLEKRIQTFEADKRQQEQQLAGLKAAVVTAEQAVVQAREELRDILAKLTGGTQGDAAPESGYDFKSGQWTGGRPKKPGSHTSLKGIDEEMDALTAHHIYPWNKIEADLNRALAAQDEGALRTLFAFGEFTPDPSFFVELKKAPQDRSYEFADTLNRAVPLICWSPANVFMGPSTNKRDADDDPHENVDTAYSKSGLPTPSSALGELLERDGGVGKASELTKRLLRNIRSGDGTTAREYDPREWATNAQGKRYRAGKVSI